MTRHPKRRAGFTLIELLVVMGIMIVLATLALLIVPDALNRSKAAEGGERLQQWLLTAKQRALRDQAPRGLRLLPDLDDPTIVRQLEIIEVPDDLAPKGFLNVPQARVGADFATVGPQPHQVFVTGAGDLRPFVEPGDWLELTESGSQYRIIPAGAGVGLEYPTPQGAPDTTRMVVAPQIREARLAPFVATQGGLRFVRNPKPLMGEDVLELPTEVVIDLNKCVGLAPRANPLDPIDIAFSSAGPVTPAQIGRIVLWVEHRGDDGLSVGEDTLMTIYTRTGAIQAHPKGPATNVYQYTQDGLSSGL